MKYNEKMKYNVRSRFLVDIINDLDSEKIILSPFFQRKLVWAQKHKRAFIKTVLEGLPFPEIYIASGDVDLTTAQGQELLVDGQQRVTTLYQYFLGSREFRLGDGLRAFGGGGRRNQRGRAEDRS